MAVFKTRRLRRSNRRPRAFDFAEQANWQPVLNAESVFLFFDLDGSLVEIAPQPSDVSLSEHRKQVLRDLLAVPECSIAVVSGRPISELQRLIGLREVFYVGNHGLEWVAPDGTRNIPSLDKPVIDALQSLREQFRSSMAAFEGVFLEDKDIALALHYRRAPRGTAARAKTEFVRSVHRYQQQGVKLQLLAGKEVIEARPAGTAKADAVTQILARYAATAFPVYIGDDLTDESALYVVAEKGLAILVAETPRTTAASFYLRNPSEVYAFVRCLSQWRSDKSRSVDAWTMTRPFGLT